jgi:DNA polymerase
LEGHVFVGPAGRVLDRALDTVGIARSDVYITNAVKHFNWRPAGKARIHKKPGGRHIRACAPWWEAELETIQPALVCCLGAVAAQALLGPAFRVTKQRGEVVALPSGLPAIATIHPSAVLRSDDRDAAFAGFVHDLEVVRQVLEGAESD